MTRTRHPLKSTQAARRLIRAALRRHGTQRAAAKALGLPSHGQLAKMLHGEIRDTPAMKAALARADARAKRAWAMVRVEQGADVDIEQGLVVVSQLERDLAALKATLSSGAAPRRERLLRALGALHGDGQ